ncbi:MAG: translation initiation factor IF-6 [Euryarchaeota archaeon]|nr:translation initiation factor IF-6 [Euryarchaeota archaeon]
MLKLLEVAGNVNVGVYIRASEHHVFYTSSATKREVTEILEGVTVPGIATTIAGSNVVGSLLAANGHGIIVADIVLKEELKRLEKTGLKVHRLAELLNAAGNNILCNDRGALVNPEYSDAAVKLIEKTLGVPVQRGTLGGIGTVGMAGVANNQGAVVHPKVTDEEKETARRVLGGNVLPGTINRGSALIGAGVTANSKGALIGRESTGVEINRLEDALGLL